MMTQFDPPGPLALPADTLMAGVLDGCARALGLHGAPRVTARLAAGDPAAWRQFRRTLAERVAHFLATLDAGIKAVYLYDPDLFEPGIRSGEKERSIPVHLVVWSRRKTAALLSLAAALDRALTQEAGSQLGLGADEHLLDVQVITDDDVENRVGFAGLLLRLEHQAPLVWSRSSSREGRGYWPDTC